MVGPSVSRDLAIEFIRRTDVNFSGYGFTNDRVFEQQFKDWLGLGDDEDWQKHCLRKEAFQNAFGYVKLEHLSSHWIASANARGPDGPVSPIGQVYLRKNFGKWPSNAEIESDLHKIARNFPWLSFKLFLWNNQNEDIVGLPTQSWWLKNGRWGPRAKFDWSYIRPQEDISVALMRIVTQPASNREITWKISTLKDMWGSQVDAARNAADQAVK